MTSFGRRRPGRRTGADQLRAVRGHHQRHPVGESGSEQPSGGSGSAARPSLLSRCAIRSPAERAVQAPPLRPQGPLTQSLTRRPTGPPLTRSLYKPPGRQPQRQAEQPAVVRAATRTKSLSSRLRSALTEDPLRFQGIERAGQARPGGGRWPPRASMASAMSALGERNPNASRVSSRILVFVDSIRALGQAVLRARRRWPRCLTMHRCRCTKAGLRPRRAQLWDGPGPLSSLALDLGGVSGASLAVAPDIAGSVFSIHSGLSRSLSVESWGSSTARNGMLELLAMPRAPPARRRSTAPRQCSAPAAPHPGASVARLDHMKRYRAAHRVRQH